MTTQQIQRLRARQPFEPFRIVAADGSRYDVRHPEKLAITGNGRIIVVAMQDYAATLDLLLVMGIEQPIPPRRNGTRWKAFAPGRERLLIAVHEYLVRNLTAMIRPWQLVKP